LVEELARLGYATTSATSVMQLAAHLSRWLSSEDVDLGGVSGAVIERFVAVRRATYANHYSTQALRPVLVYLRREGLVPAEQPSPAPSSPVEVLLARYHQRLVVDRGLTSPVEAHKLARILKQRAKDMLGYFDRPGTSNGPTEAINGRLEHLRGTALGFRNLTHYIARSLLEAGGFRPTLHPPS